LRICDPRKGRERGRTGCQLQKSTARKFHGDLLLRRSYSGSRTARGTRAANGGYSAA
jgi:hypothetical protein